MKESSKYKRFKHSTITNDTLPLSDTRSSIIHTIWRYIHYPNMPDLRRLEKEAQIKEIDTSKTDKIPSVYDRAFWLFLHLIFEMEKHFPNYYSYEQKYHNLASMFVPGYQCSNVYINVEKRASMNKDIQ